MTVRLASVAENAFNAVERIAEYSRLKEEAPAVVEGSAPDDWPSAGKVSLCPHLHQLGCLESVDGLCHSRFDYDHAHIRINFNALGLYMGFATAGLIMMMPTSASALMLGNCIWAVPQQIWS